MNPAHYIKFYQKLQFIDGFIGLGWGLKETGNKITGTIGWRIYVRTKLTQKQLPVSSQLPAFFKDIPTDIVVKHVTQKTGSTSSKFSSKGCMIANNKGVPGTLGCFAHSNSKNEEVFLTSFHVLFSKGASEQDPVWVQNGNDNKWVALGKTLYGKIGTVQYNNIKYYIDCAVGTATCSRKRYQRLKSYNPSISGIDEAHVGSLVSKIGCNTGLSQGIIIDKHYPDEAIVNGKIYHAPNQLLIKPVSNNVKLSSPLKFSEEGDSGAVIVNEQNRGVGLLWGSNANGEGVACHMSPVVSELKLLIKEQKIHERLSIQKKLKFFFNFLSNQIISSFERLQLEYLIRRLRNDFEK